MIGFMVIELIFLIDISVIKYKLIVLLVIYVVFLVLVKGILDVWVFFLLMED